MPDRSRAASSGPTGSSVTSTSNFGMPRDLGAACEETWVTSPLSVSPRNALPVTVTFCPARSLTTSVSSTWTDAAMREKSPILSRSSPRRTGLPASSSLRARPAASTLPATGASTAPCPSASAAARNSARADSSSSRASSSASSLPRARGGQLLLRRLEVELLAPELPLRVLVLVRGDQSFLEQEAALVDGRATAFHVEPGLGEAPARLDHFRAVLPVLQRLDALQRPGLAPARSRVCLPGPGEIQLQQHAAFRDVLPGPEMHHRNIPFDRAAHGHHAPGCERAPERDAVRDPAGLDRHPAPFPGRYGGGLCGHPVEQVQRARGPEARTEEQPHRQHHAEPLHHPHLAQRRSQRRIAVLDLPVGVLEAAVLLLRLLRQPEFRLAKFAQFGDVAEHRDRRHRLAGLSAPQIGGGDRERARLAAALDADYAALRAGALGRRVEHLLREIVEALPRDEQLGEVPPVRLAGLKAQYALGRPG